ncbi:MAG: right-handed parallel beta-helix repeat-containing protein, partial [Terriglobia bacterium]
MTRRSLLMSGATLAALQPYGAFFGRIGATAPASAEAATTGDLLYCNERNPQAVREVLSGRRTAANAAWWGFNDDDSTAALQATFDSGAKTVVVPFMGQPWITRPLRLRGNQEVTFQPGVLVLAKRGEFLGKSDSLLNADRLSNVALRGYGATLRMWKRDYEHAPYEKAEWRMGVAIRGCKNVLIEGLRVESTGGDGFYVDGSGDRLWSENIAIRNCVADDNYRQGISVISAVDLLVENCVFSNTGGTAPE